MRHCGTVAREALAPTERSSVRRSTAHTTFVDITVKTRRTVTVILLGLAEAELHFAGGVLSGLKLIGFAIWERRGGASRSVTFPASATRW